MLRFSTTANFCGGRNEKASHVIRLGNIGFILVNATEEQRKNWRVIGRGFGIHWEDVDEDLSTEGMSRGAPAPPQPLVKAS